MDTPLLNFRKVHFVTSAPDIRHLPNDGGIEIAFAGRSNAGKSSALNALTQQRQLARTSKTPGRTQLINLFELEPGKRLVDLPGYGYAQVPIEMKLKWQAALSEYLQKRESLKALVLLMDIRHPLKDLDLQMLEWASNSDLNILVLLTKADKLNPGPRKTVVQQVRKATMVFGDSVRVEAFSSLKGTGVDEVTRILSDWYQPEDTPDEISEAE
ncbi:GTP-binding protein HSR1-related [Tolumonas auensis DSM 9187]|uniref:Probable GTP-binding protein EngB n=1 Tax=Tolumonas auensis (strain DSM 9187 / NBRC 110442 / TA 4) TaxID=595494 RepID=ENGB_TOLAT|nr:ribosome biogenesis GTP-binding protein YihA/YsxC [Tolumonas auensis]C4L968.1 RecName: Full=Probable GTP-binding protein EngB [Tolumonas auensis DSM 9187]ACQ91967.1 GTP-binding protein HSR1-related [Tolumonas auensis DSM 9187]NCB58271.1 YihA family ribosome biogenesis GTP-binding protein [Gammaproteobacteria bacterium]